ncbi:DEAD/DEAH box helicase [Micromonospora sp. WMMD730]|uniref:DEAD/DEAH box helicase n=1 Tax=Micromonospora sp. WMMD730 TaxID=3404128 RepID=UPI003B9471CD
MTGNATIVKGTNDKPVASDSLARFFEGTTGLDGQLFIGYPIIGGVEGKHPIDAVYVSPTQGVVIFDLVEGSDVSGYDERQDDAATKLGSRLLGYKELVQRRQLAIEIHTITYAPALSRVPQPDEAGYIVANDDNLKSSLSGLTWPSARPEIYERTLSAIQNISTIRKARSGRKIENAASRGAKLQHLEAAIATLDNLQGKAVIETVEGVQRIRGLAGSGKTIVLALKAAYLHAQHPEWRIAVTFNTRSLKGHLVRLINLFAIEATGEEPDWSNLRVINAWGARGGSTREGIYYEFCNENGTEYLDYGAAKNAFGRVDAFKGACRAALDAVPDPNQTYDAVLIDEAQDLPPEFLNLCYLMLRDPKRLVYAYDELQNLSNSSVPPAESIFGLDATGRPKVKFDGSAYDLGARRDIILSKCYRNSRPVLVTAHALGFGIYRKPAGNEKTGLVQMFDEADLWKDIGYRVKEGALRDGRAVTLERTADTSPGFLEAHSLIDDLVQFHVFNDTREQAEWIAAQIQENLTMDELRPDDIVVVNPDPLTTSGAGVGRIRKLLFDKGVTNHLAGVDTTADVFFRPELEKSVTFSGIHRAKGNEAAMVYVINAHESYGAQRNLATVRNRLFTAITRSKAWVRVVGVGPDMVRLKEEFEATRRANFELRFTYPTESERNRLQVVHRDFSPEQARLVKQHDQDLASLLQSIRARKILPGDLDDGVRAELRSILEQDDE